jgi:hypothetical protein
MKSVTNHHAIFPCEALRKCRHAGTNLLSVGSAICVLALIAVAPGKSQGATIQVFTDRTAWQNAMSGLSIQTETFNDFTGFTYQAGGAPAFQFPSGITEVGRLRFEVERPSGNLIIGGNFFDSVNGTTFWRVETSTQNGSTPPVTPALLFSQDTYGFGADWNFVFTPRSTITIGDTTLLFRNYLGAGIHFLGFASSTPFSRVEFNVESPFNDIFHADNVTFSQVPEPSTFGICLAAIIGFSAVRRASCDRRGVRS